ncbi:adenosylhomocysteine nucleosidase [Carnobacterium iners]|uniref:5'-methylthioadenosine/S-adenosylhomocysteine nucleosidase n=1 Tax=Carnobacterium iners TaxID=1073423 RepID=A0A1X7NMW4_9LACT|nr:5'-methylthioadenosine/adenosylhomocysteine nucleosidase [Carnobacterium iners]SEK31222.1 adenosylhomocysteine nucleosidase [Carnobacterium iners]SMH39341.1 adenosylhomocysteine nucleosidase [Carnobacterium iners]
MRIGIIGAMEEEIILLKSKMESPKEWLQANALFISGEIEGHQVVLVQSGIGKVNAAIAATLLISQCEVETLINTGSAGGIGKGLAVGDIVVSTEVAYHDVDATIFNYEIGQVPQMPARYTADKRLVKMTIAAAKNVGLHPIEGLIVTSDSFIAGKIQKEKIMEDFPDALAAEMEGAAIAQVCYQFKKSFVIVRAMSDVANEEASISFDEFIIEAGKKSANMVLELLKISM